MRVKQLGLVSPMINLRNSLYLTSALLFLCMGTAHAQLAPTPRKSPRTPVSKEILSGKTTPLSPSTLLRGPATIVDTERLRINNTEIRLFGVVPPQMGASFGPQARAVLDSLAQGTVTCQIKDRTRDGHYLALCHNAAQADFGLELLRRGLAACARGSLHGTPYDTPYQAAEMAAESQKLGLWSTSLPSAASESSIRAVMTKAEKAKAEAQKAKQEAEQAKQEVELAKAELAKTTPAPSQTAGLAQDETNQHPLVVKLSAGDKAAMPPLPQLNPDLSVHLESATTADDIQAMLMTPQPDATPAPPADTHGLIERYQLLLSGLLLLGTTLVLSGTFTWNKFRQKQEDIKSIAAALHGELMAARSVCQARLSKIAQEETSENTTWPRIRIIVFQAYIGKLGFLGAELSRQIASIYGMASDYASYYNTIEPRSEGTSKQQALEALVRHIEEVIPRLSKIEKNGKITPPSKVISSRAALKGPSNQHPLSLSLTPNPPSPSGGQEGNLSSSTGEQDMKAHTISSRETVHASLSKAKSEIVSDTTHPAKQTPPPHEKSGTEQVPNLRRTKPATNTTMKSKTQRTAQHVERAAQAAIKAVSTLNLKTPIIERLSQLKAFAKGQIDSDKKQRPVEAMDDFSIPDYANLTEEELEALLYAEEEMILASPAGKWKQVG